MSSRRHIRPEALIELRDAAEWYEEQREGLGAALIDEFERTLEEALGRLSTSRVIAKTAGGLPVRRFRLELLRALPSTSPSSKTCLWWWPSSTPAGSPATGATA